MNLLKKLLLSSLIVSIILLQGYGNHVLAKSSLPSLKPVAEVDLKKYSGTWYEIAFVPYFFEKKGQRDAIIKYTPTGAFTFQDAFQATLPNGKIKKFTGSLKSKAKNNNGKVNGEFRSTFIKIFGWQYWLGVDYLITGLGDNYDFAIVSLPNGKLHWILSRTPKLSMSQLKEIDGILKQQHINACDLTIIPQSGGLQHEESFCEILEFNH